jgi:hypothetical protein
LAYQPPASSIFLSEQTSQQQSASSIFLSEQISTSHQPNEQADWLQKLHSDQRRCGMARAPCCFHLLSTCVEENMLSKYSIDLQ